MEFSEIQERFFERFSICSTDGGLNDAKSFSVAFREAVELFDGLTPEQRRKLHKFWKDKIDKGELE